MVNNAGSPATFNTNVRERKVNGAFSEGDLHEAGKGWALRLCLADAAAFDRFIYATRAGLREADHPAEK